MGEPMTDVDYSSDPRRKVDEIRLVPGWEVEQAAQEVVRAAVAARQREIIPHLHTISGEHQHAYQDIGTGKYWVPRGVGGYVDAATGEVRDDDPRNIDPNQYQWIVEEFRYFHERWPNYPRTMAEQCANAKQSIQSGRMTPIVGVGRMVASKWDGTASKNFHDYFLAPFVSQAVTNQQALLDELAVALYAYEALLRQARVTAMEIATKTRDALDGLRPEAAGLEWEDALGLAGVVVGVITVVASGGSAGLVLLGLLGSGISVASLGHEDLGRISGDTVDELLQSLRTTLNAARQEMDAVEEAIADKLRITKDNVDRVLAGSPLDMATYLPNEPDRDGVPNVTAGELPRPGSNGFQPRG